MPAKTAKNKSKKKPTKTKKLAATKVTVKKAVPKKAVKKATVKKQTVKKKTATTKARVHKPTRAKESRPSKKTLPVKSRKAEPKTFSLSRMRRPGAGSAGQSGDLQGLSRVEDADSESVAELLEEGNTFEAEVVAGVEAADDDEMEVRTHEVPEDDVPDEYLDEY
jgi:hypothetical protein